MARKTKEPTAEQTAGEGLEPGIADTESVFATMAEPVMKAAPSSLHVYCKLPAGLVFKLPSGERVVLKGSNSSALVGGFGLTRVPTATWNQVKAIFGSLPVFVKGLIFDETTASRGLAKATEHAGVKNGFEGVDPKNPGLGVVPDDGR